MIIYAIITTNKEMMEISKYIPRLLIGIVLALVNLRIAALTGAVFFLDSPTLVLPLLAATIIFGLAFATYLLRGTTTILGKISLFLLIIPIIIALVPIIFRLMVVNFRT